MQSTSVAAVITINTFNNESCFLPDNCLWNVPPVGAGWAASPERRIFLGSCTVAGWGEQALQTPCCRALLSAAEQSFCSGVAGRELHCRWTGVQPCLIDEDLFSPEFWNEKCSRHDFTSLSPVGENNNTNNKKTLPQNTCGCPWEKDGFPLTADFLLHCVGIAGTARHGGMDQTTHTSWTCMAAPGARSLPLVTLTQPLLSPVAPGSPNGHSWSARTSVLCYMGTQQPVLALRPWGVCAHPWALLAQNG